MLRSKLLFIHSWHFCRDIWSLRAVKFSVFTGKKELATPQTYDIDKT